MKSIGVLIFRATYLAGFSVALAFATAAKAFFTTKAEAFLADWNLYVFAAVSWLTCLIVIYGVPDHGGFRRRAVTAVMVFLMTLILMAGGFAYYHEHYFNFPQIKGFEWLPYIYTIIPVPGLLIVTAVSLRQKSSANQPVQTTPGSSAPLRV